MKLKHVVLIGVALLLSALFVLGAEPASRARVQPALLSAASDLPAAR